MKHSALKIILLLVFVFIAIIGNSQTLKYTIFSNDSEIGNLKVTKKTVGNTFEIDVISEVKVKLFVKIKIKYILNATYEDNELISSSVTTYLNGKVHSTSTAKKNGDSYTLTQDGNVTKYNQSISFSGALLYFKEPKYASNIFSEFDNAMQPISKISANTYEMKSASNGAMNQYYYKNGTLIKSVVHQTLMTFTIVKD